MSFPVAPARRAVVGWAVLGIVGAVLAFAVVLVVKDRFLDDQAEDAAVGDCISAAEDVQVDHETESDAEVVDCGSAEATFSVVGRVDGETDIKSKSCEHYFQQNEKYYVYGSTADHGYLLCLRPKAA